MGLTNYKLGQLISLSDERNNSGKYLLDSVKGISTEKEFIDTKANLDGVLLDSYKIVNPGEFAYVPDTSRRGDKIALAFNNSDNSVLISSIYTTFKCIRKDILIPEYLYIFFNRPEFDRYSRFNSWGSARETFSWEDFCDIDITLPDIESQKRFIDVYLSLQNNLISYQSKVDELKLVCDGFIEQLINSYERERIGAYLQQSDERNINNSYTLEDLRGISIEKKFINTKADMIDVSLTSYSIVRPSFFAFVPVTSRNGGKITLAYNDSSQSFVVSSAYVVFSVIDSNKLLPDYLFLFFCRPEFDRYARFHSWGSAREVFSMDDMNNVSIPIPDLSVQREIVNIHKCYLERQRIACSLKELLNNLCPVLTKGSIN